MNGKKLFGIVIAVVGSLWIVTVGSNLAAQQSGAKNENPGKPAPMKLIITMVDYNPPELEKELPLSLTLIRQLPGPDRPDYWLAAVDKPLKWNDDGTEKIVGHVIVAARWQGTQIEPLAKDLPVNIAYVTDSSQLDDESVKFEKSRFVAIGVGHVTDGAIPKDNPSILSGTIAPAFGKGKSD